MRIKRDSLTADPKAHVLMNHVMGSFSRFASLAAVLLCTTVSGCGSAGPETFAISGQVAYDGQTVNNGNIGLIPKESSTGKSVGADIVGGRYELSRYEGPQEGHYKVVIYAERPSGRKIQADEGSPEMIDELEQFIPEIYNSRSTLTVEISSDRDDLDFDLEKPKQRSRRRR